MYRTELNGALLWGPWRIVAIEEDGRRLLLITDDGHHVAECQTTQEALDVLSRHRVPVEKLTREKLRL